MGVSIIFYFLVLNSVLKNYVYAGAGNEWGYEGSLGPSHWHIDYPVCGGQKQSPIDIEPSKSVLNTSLTEFVFNGYQSIENVNMSIQNNGHTVEVDLSGSPLTLAGGGLPGIYKAEQFHFHWGSKDERGSEHLISGNPFPMEMHIVHYSTVYDDIHIAMNMTDGLAVLGFFFKVGNTNEALDHVIDHFNEIAHKDDHVGIETFPLYSLFPKDLKTYYRYYGSLTTPPCYESIIWTIFKTPIEASEEQLEKFRHSLYSNGLNDTDMFEADDFRPVQLFNGRVVYASHEDAIYFSSCDSVYKTSLWRLLWVFILYFCVFKNCFH